MTQDFKIGPLNHVGVAVPDIQEAMDTYRTLYGATDITEPFDMPAQGVKVCFVNLPNSQIDWADWKLPESEESCSIDQCKHFRSLLTSAVFFSEEVRRGEAEMSSALVYIALPVL